MTTARTGVPRGLRPSTWALTTKLVAAVLCLFLAVTIATGMVTILLLERSLTQKLDSAVAASLFRAGGRPDDGPGHDVDERPPPAAGGESLTLVLQGGSAVSRVERGRAVTTLTSAQVDKLKAAGIGSRPKTVDVPNLGSYRVAAATQFDGDIVISGLPLSSVTDTIGEATSLLLGGTIVGLVLAGAGGTWLVRRNLAPLQRVAHTATKVSRLKLDQGDVALAERVPDADTDPRTEVGQVGLALNNMLDNVEGALQSRHESEQRVRQFVADASHELRTPLASIRGYAELSRREREPVPPSVTHALTRVESEALRMQGLVEDLLLLARLDAGRPLDRTPVDLSLLAMDAVSDAHAAAPDHSWLLDLPEEPVEVTGDQARLHQVVANLLANARAHTPPGTRVVTSIQPEDGWVRVSVADDGPGVPPALQRNVFQRFTRGDDSRNRAAGSTGLGLSIVDAVAKSHGGRVELSSAPGDTTFTVLLPAT